MFLVRITSNFLKCKLAGCLKDKLCLMKFDVKMEYFVLCDRHFQYFGDKYYSLKDK